MHPLLQRCFWVRDHDLKRWGKPVAILFAMVGLLCSGVSVAAHRLTGKLTASLERSYNLDLKLAGTLPESETKKAITGSFHDNHGISLEIVAALKVFGVWAMGGVGLLALSSAAYTWRAAELASKLSDYPDANPLS